VRQNDDVDWTELNIHLEKLAHTVKRAILEHKRPHEIHGEVAKHFKEPQRLPELWLPRIVSMARKLSSKETRDLKTFMDNDAGLRAVLNSSPQEQASIHAELLGNLWLGTYFYGAPFGHSWEHVRRIAEDMGGYPGVQCLNKALGDTFRRTHLIHDSGTLTQTEKEDGVLVYTHRPFAILSFDLMPPPNDVVNLQRTELDAQDAVGARCRATDLGRAYYWMQLRLCVEKDVPVTYIVVAEVLRKSFERANLERARQSKPSMTPDEWAADLSDWTLKTLGDKQERERLADKVQIIIVDKDRPTAIPICALGHKAGIYVLLPPEDVVGGAMLHFPVLGNRIGRALLPSYRSALSLKSGLTRCKDKIVVSPCSDSKGLTDIFRKLLHPSVA